MYISIYLHLFVWFHWTLSDTCYIHALTPFCEVEFHQICFRPNFSYLSPHDPIITILCIFSSTTFYLFLRVAYSWLWMWSYGLILDMGNSRILQKCLQSSKTLESDLLTCIASLLPWCYGVMNFIDYIQVFGRIKFHPSALLKSV